MCDFILVIITLILRLIIVPISIVTIITMIPVVVMFTVLFIMDLKVSAFISIIFDIITPTVLVVVTKLAAQLTPSHAPYPIDASISDVYSFENLPHPSCPATGPIVDPERQL